MKVAPSILACDFSKLKEEVISIESAGADLIHLDIMDGNFVPNLTFGPCVVRAVKKHTKLPLDIHLMIEEPFRYIDVFSEAGADIISFHSEAEGDIQKTIEKISKNGVKPAIAIKPNTPVESILKFLDTVYMVLIMTVEPGFGGQKFISNTLEKIKILKKECISRKLDVKIEVDGGINKETARDCKKSGADICVAGTAIFSSKNRSEAIELLK